MVKKAIHHFNRGLVIGLELIGLLIVVGFVAWLGLLWRLSNGPIDANFLTERVEKALNEKQTGLRFDIGATQLTWGGRFEPFELEMKDVQITREDKTPVLAVSKIGVYLSKRGIIFGRIVPRVVKVYGPALRVIRSEDGHVSLNLGEDTAAGVATQDAPTDPNAETAGEDQGHIQLIRSMLQQLRDDELFGMLGGLREVQVSDATVLYEDRGLGVQWTARKAKIVVARQRQGISADAIVDLAINGEEKASHGGIIRATVFHSWKNDWTKVNVYFSNINPSQLAQESQSLAAVAGVNLPLKGSFVFNLDPDFKLYRIKFIAGSDPGTFNAADLYPTPLKVKGFYISGGYDTEKSFGLIDTLKVNLGGPALSGRMRLQTTEEGRVIDIRASLDNTPMDDLPGYWPEKLTPDPRAWVTQHLSKGIADHATLDASFLYNEAAEKKLSVKKLGGTIDFHDMTVDYFPPLMPVKGVAGKATYDVSSFNLDLKSGKLGDMTVDKSVIRITGLDTQTADQHANIDISVSLNGPLKMALTVLDSKPLEYPKMLGLQTEEVGGNAKVDVNFKFPLHKALALDEVKVTADADANDVLLKNVVSGMDVTGGPLHLTFADASLSVKGDAKLAAMPVTFDWRKNFSKTAADAQTLQARLPLDADALYRFGVPADAKFGGVMPSDVIYKQGHDGKAFLSLSGDLTGASFNIPVASYVKTAGKKGSLGLSLQLNGNRAEKITGLKLETEDALAAGDIYFSNGSVRKASFTDLKLGKTAVSLDVEQNAAGTYVMKVTGGQLDASDVFKNSDAPGSDADAAIKTTPLDLTMMLDKLFTGENKVLTSVRAVIRRNAWKRMEYLEFDATAGGKPVSARYLPQPAGGYALRVSAGNAGAALSALGISDAVRGGQLSVTAAPNIKAGARDMAGTVTLTDFSLKDAPLLARLVNVMSLTGLGELLNGKGISFKKARATFSWSDRGPPDNPNNIRLIRLKDGQTSGASLGLTFEGNIDNWAQVYDLNGTIIPVSDLSKIVGAIPLVGDVLTAGGEGVFAATYTIKGPKDQPSVTVNPLAALAPGVLRKIFFEN